MQSSSRIQPFKLVLAGASPATDTKAVQSCECRVESLQSALRRAVLMEAAVMAMSSFASANNG